MLDYLIYRVKKSFCHQSHTLVTGMSSDTLMLKKMICAVCLVLDYIADVNENYPVLLAIFADSLCFCDVIEE